jgi:A/G-specific adenine glycosylase
MLQQTRVAAVVPYYERFLTRFPDVGSLARAPLDRVLALWSGLGYYRRARQLHAAARILRRDGFPETFDGWRALPGIGDYTAAAISSIAFGAPEAVVDGNVERVLCRRHGKRRGELDLRALARAWLLPEAPGDFNQAVMELGATICLPRAPRCGDCPIRCGCRGRTAPERFPGPKRRARPVVERLQVVVDISKGRVRMHRRKGGRLDGLWDLPEGGGEPVGTVRHSILDRRYLITVNRGGSGGRSEAESPPRDVKGSGGRRIRGRRFTPDQVREIPLATAARKCLERIGFLNDK